MYLLPSGQLYALPGGLGCACCGPSRGIRMQQSGQVDQVFWATHSREGRRQIGDQAAIRVLKLTSKRHRLLEVLPKTFTEFFGELWPEVEGLFPLISRRNSSSQETRDPSQGRLAQGLVEV